MFNISGAVMVSVDKTLLNHFIPASNFGQYIAQSDLALRMNVISNGLGTYLFPKFIKIESELGKNRLQAQVSKVLLVAYLIMLPIVLTLSVFSREIVAIFFGDSFVTELPIYQIFVLGFYINIMGFILVPYQRATGNYTTSRRIYGFTAIIMLIVGLRLIPEHGIFGALICYLIARCSDFFMLISFIKESNFKTHGGPVFLTISFCIFLYVWVSIG
jgi:O-antigen/teichoic acid export membrane protein